MGGDKNSPEDLKNVGFQTNQSCPGASPDVTLNTSC